MVMAIGSYAQQNSILLKVVDVKNNPVGFATISIFNQTDSLPSLNAITDSFGIQIGRAHV